MLLLNEIQFSHNSIIDPFGRVFFHEDKIYRLINEQSVSECMELLNSNLFKELIELGYIPNTKIAVDIEIDSNDLILNHQRFIDSKTYEWSFSMYKDAAILILKINQICNKYGYELKDAHPNNILFNNGKPIFIDIGSFQKRSNCQNWIAYSEFVNTMCVPLILWNKGEYFFLRSILESNFSTYRIIPTQQMISVEYIQRLTVKTKIYRKNIIDINTNSKIIILFFRFLNKLIRCLRRKRNYNFFIIEKRHKKIQLSDVEKIDKQRIDSLWNDYHTKYLDSNKIISTSRFDRLLVLFMKFCKDAKTVIDLAGNQGVFSFLLEEMNHFESIIMVDYDENAVDIAYSYVKMHQRKVNPFLLNWMHPVNLDSTTDRLHADIVFALAITHHLLLTQGFSIVAIFERLKMYSKNM
jgi:hypothetical protein